MHTWLAAAQYQLHFIHKGMYSNPCKEFCERLLDSSWLLLYYIVTVGSIDQSRSNMVM